MIDDQNGRPALRDVPVIITASPKSVALAAGLGFFFGPIGLLYASPIGAIVMFLVNVIVGLVTLGVGLVFTWPGCVIWAMVAAHNYNRRLATRVADLRY